MQKTRTRNNSNKAKLFTFPFGRHRVVAAIMPTRYSDHFAVGAASATLVPVESTAAANTAAPLELKMIRPENLLNASFSAPSTIALRFADGLQASLNAELLGMPMDRIDWPTLTASPEGEKAVVKGVKGDPVPIDSASIRYLVDAKYAERMDAELKRLQFTDEELEQLDLGEPPHGFLEQTDIDLTRESWK